MEEAAIRTCSNASIIVPKDIKLEYTNQPWNTPWDCTGNMTGVFITPDFKNNVKAFLKIVLLPKEVQDRRKPQQSVLKVPAVMEVVHALELTELLLNLNLCESRYLNELQHMIPAHEKVFAIFLASNYCLPQEISAPLHQLGYPNLLTWPSECQYCNNNSTEIKDQHQTLTIYELDSSNEIRASRCYPGETPRASLPSRNPRASSSD